MKPKIWAATKSFIMHKGKVLIIRESSKYEDGINPGKYDVVGGRVEPGQRFDESLRREVKEETGLDIEIGAAFFVNEWRPIVRGEQWQIIGTFFICNANTDHVTLSKDHDHYEWIDPKDYKNYDFYPTIIPAFEEFLKRR
jgi:8-oxo-dGTP diphosphatase